MTEKLANGTVHTLPIDVQKIIQSNKEAVLVWQDITPLARNEWICWITDAKKLETRNRRIDIMLDKFSQGKRRPCCWAGCTHR